MKSLPDIVIPQPFAEALHRLAHSALHTFATPHTAADGRIGWVPRSDAPELIVVLLRTGELHFRPLEALAQAHGVALPPVIYTHIGREMTARWEEGSTGTMIYWLLDEDDDLFDNIDAWLRDDAYAQQIVTQMHHEAEAHQIIPERVVVIDDCMHEGGTSTMARLLIKQAFELVDKPVFFYLYCGNIGPIIRATFANERLPEQHIVYIYLDELMRGYMETDISCERITMPAHLEALRNYLKIIS